MTDPHAQARDPHTPAARLAELALTHPQAVLANPALPLLCLTQPGVLHHWPALAVARLAERPEAPEWLLLQALSHPDPRPQLAVLARASLPGALARRAARSPWWRVRAALAAHPDLPAEVTGALHQDPDHGVRLALTQRADLPQHVTRALARDPHPLVRRQMRPTPPDPPTR